MENGSQDTSPQTVRELSSQLSPKRRRTDWANSCTEMFCKTVCCPSSASTLQMTANLASTDKCGVIGDEEPYGTAVIVDLIANLSASHTRDVPTGSPEGCPLALLTDEQPLDAEFVKLCQHLQDDVGGKLGETHTSSDSCTNASNHSDCKLWRGSLEDSPLVGCNLPSRNGLEGRQAVDGVCEVQVSNCSWNTWHPAEHKKSFQKEDGHIFREIIPCRERGTVENSSDSYIHYSDKDLFHSNIENIPSGNLAEGVKNESDELELQICANGDVAACETKGTASDNGLSRSTIHCAAQCAEGSIVPCDVASVGKIATESVGLEDDVLWAKGEHAVGEMIAETWRKDADHPAETSPPAGISQEHAEGDNDAGRFSVIDPAIWRETDRESGGTLCYSESRAVADLVPSLKVYQIETPPALVLDITPRLLNHCGETQECKHEKDNPCPPYTAPLVCPNRAGRKQDKPEEESSSFFSSELHPEDKQQESLKETVEHLHKVQTQSGFFPVISDEPKTLKDDTQNELVSEDKGSQVNVKEELSSAEHGKSSNSMNVAQRLGQYGKYGNKSASINEDYNTEWVFDHMYCTVCPLIEETIEGTSNSSEAEVNSQAWLTPQCVQSPSWVTEKPQDDCVGEMSNSTSESQPVGRPKQGSQSICFLDCRLTEETVTVDYLTSGDAVVPSELTPLLSTRDEPAALSGTERSSLLSIELDSFQRIQDSLNNDCSSGDTACTMLFTNSEDGNVGMTNEQEVMPKEEEQKGKEGEELQYQNTRTANGSESCDSCHDEDQDLTKPGAPAVRQADRQTACSSPGSCLSLVDLQDDLGPHALDLNQLPKLEMKKQFDMVLRELNLYFAISMNDFTNYTYKESFPEQLKDATEATKGKTSSCNDDKLSSRESKHQRDALLGKQRQPHSAFTALSNFHLALGLN